MAKTKTVFFCNECGHESPKWVGRCPGCGQWNTMTEETVVTGKKGTSGRRGLLETDTRPVALSDIEALEEPRIHLPSGELNRVLGGGLVAGSLTLI